MCHACAKHYHFIMLVYACLFGAALGLREEDYLECDKNSYIAPCYDLTAVGKNAWMDKSTDPKDIDKRLGTLDAWLEVTNLEYVKENIGVGGWDLSEEALALRNQPDGVRGPNTASVCYEGGMYNCPPGPCTVLDINYLADLRYYKPGHQNNKGQNIVAGRSYCGAAFGTQMEFLNRYTTTDGSETFERKDTLPPPKIAKRTLAYLPGSVPDDVQVYVPMNDEVNQIPAWWYSSFQGWQTNLGMRTDGLKCEERLVPRWMIPPAGISGGEDPDRFRDTADQWYGPYAAANDRKADNSFHITNLTATNLGATAAEAQGAKPPQRDAHKKACEQNFKRGTPLGNADPSRLGASCSYDSTEKNTEDCIARLCDVNSSTAPTEHFRSSRPNEPYPGTWHGSASGAFTLCDANVLSGVFLGISTRHHRELNPTGRLAGLFTGNSSKYADGIYRALQYYLEDISAPCASPHGCDLVTLLKDGLESDDPVAQKRAKHAMFLGQIATVLRPCESPLVREAKVKGATYNHWRREHYNPGQNRAAVERIVLGCDPANKYMNEQCAAIRGRHQWSTVSGCIMQGKCTMDGDACCNANHKPAVSPESTVQESESEKAHHYTSYYCTDVGVNSADIEANKWEEIFHTTTRQGALNSWAGKKKKSRVGKAGQDLLKHERKCGMVISFDTSMNTFIASSPKFNNDRFHARNAKKTRVGNLLSKAEDGHENVLIGVGAGTSYLLPNPVSMVVLAEGLIHKYKKDRTEDVSDLIGATFGYGDTGAFVWRQNLSTTCSTSIQRVFTIVSSCVAYAIPWYLDQLKNGGAPDPTFDEVIDRITGTDTVGPLCAVLRVAIAGCPEGEPLCVCSDGEKEIKDGTPGPYNCQGSTSGYKRCINLNPPADNTGSELNWENLVKKAVSGPRQRYMLETDPIEPIRNPEMSIDTGGTFPRSSQMVNLETTQLPEFANDAAGAKPIESLMWGIGTKIEVDEATSMASSMINVEVNDNAGTNEVVNGKMYTSAVEYKRYNLSRARDGIKDLNAGWLAGSYLSYPDSKPLRPRQHQRTLSMRPLNRFPDTSYLPGRETYVGGRSWVRGSGALDGIADATDIKGLPPPSGEEVLNTHYWFHSDTTGEYNYAGPISGQCANGNTNMDPGSVGRAGYVQGLTCATAGAEAFYVFPMTAQNGTEERVVGPNARGQTCTAHFRVDDFLAIANYVSLFNTGPTDTARQSFGDRHLGDKFTNLGESCFGSLMTTKRVSYCGWDEATVRDIFNMSKGTDLPAYHQKDTFDILHSNFLSTTRAQDCNANANLCPDLEYNPPDPSSGYTADSNGNAYYKTGMPWNKVTNSVPWDFTLPSDHDFTNHDEHPEPQSPPGEQMITPYNVPFDKSGYIEACVGETIADSAYELMWEGIPLSHPNLTQAVHACEALRMQGCVGVQRFTSPSADDRYVLRSKAQAQGHTHLGGDIAGCTEFYLVPCLGVETCNDLFGCSEDVGVRASGQREEPSFSAPNPGAKPTTYEMGANESYLLDGLAVYTSNTRFSLNPTAFSDGRSDLDIKNLANPENAGGLSYDFNYSHWVFSKEIQKQSQTLRGTTADGFEPAPGTVFPPNSVSMVSTRGKGLGLHHKGGIRHVPLQTAAEKSKLYAFSWAGMFDKDEYVHGMGTYRFRHPSTARPTKYPGMFPMVGNGTEISFEFEGTEWKFQLNDSFVRAVTAQMLDVRTPEGFAEWKTLFWQHQQCPAMSQDFKEANSGANTDPAQWGRSVSKKEQDTPGPDARIYNTCADYGGSVTLGGFIDPHDLNNPEDEEINWENYRTENAEESFSDQYHNKLERPNLPLRTNWTFFTKGYEQICDLHACDILQVNRPSSIYRTGPDESKDNPEPEGSREYETDMFGDKYHRYIKWQKTKGLDARGISENLYAHRLEAPVSRTARTTVLRDVQQPFKCVSQNTTSFARGRPLVDVGNNEKTWSEADETYARNAFGILGFRAITIERAILEGMVRAVMARYDAIIGQMPTADAASAEWAPIKEELKAVCTDYLSKHSTMTNAEHCNPDGLWGKTLRSPTSHDGPPYKPTNNNILKLLTEPPAYYKIPPKTTSKHLDYTKVDSHELYTEHRAAVPLYEIPRSASFTNRQEEEAATPCDCDNQKIVWACRKVSGENTRLVTFVEPDLGSGPRPLGALKDKFAETDYGSSVAVFECGYSWEEPPMRTPKIGLYVPSKVDGFEIFERDIFGLNLRPEFDCDPSEESNLTDYESCGQDILKGVLENHTKGNQTSRCTGDEGVNGTCDHIVIPGQGNAIVVSVNESLLSSCGRKQKGVACARRDALKVHQQNCASEIFSTQMGPRPPKLRELIFTGLHPHPVASETIDDIDDFSEHAVPHGLSAEEISLLKSEGKAACYTAQNLYVYNGACLRWPFGATHLHTVGHGQHDEKTVEFLRSAVGKPTDFTMNTKKYTGALKMGDVAWQGYCELEHERSQFNTADNTLKDGGRSAKYRYCANDPLSFRQREQLCRTMAPHFIMYAWGLTVRDPTDVCNAETKVCLLVPGYPGSGSLSRMLDDPNVGPFHGYTFLISPYPKAVLENYYSDRALFELGNSYARTNARRHPLPSNPLPKHPLDLTRRDQVSYTTADEVLTAEETGFTHMGGSADVLALLAKMPPVTPDEAIGLFSSTLVRHVEATCKADASYRDQHPSGPDERARLLPDEEAFEHPTCDSLGFTAEQRRAYGTYFLPAEMHARNVKGHGWDDVYAPVPADFAVIDVPHVTIRSASRLHPIQYGPDEFKPRRKGGGTCTRLVVAAPHFRLFNAEFNQTGCGGLEAAAQIPIRFEGTDARHAIIEAAVLYKGGQDAVVGAVVLGGDHSLVYSGNTTYIDGMKLNISMYGESQGVRVGPEGTFATYFQLGLADGAGHVTLAKPACEASEGCKNVSRSIIQQLRMGNEHTVSYTCQGPTEEVTDRTIYEYPPGGCQVLDVSKITSVFGSGYEAGLFHRDPSTVNHEYIILAGLSLLAAALALINCGLSMSGSKAAHRAIGLVGPLPDAALYEAFRSAELASSVPRPVKPYAATMASFTRLGRVRGVVPREGPAAGSESRHRVARAPPIESEPPAAEWSTIAATARQGTLWQRHAGVGVQIQAGKTFYDAEDLLRPEFNLAALPQTLQSAIVAVRKDIKAEHVE